jgi:hypothetical protein
MATGNFFTQSTSINSNEEWPHLAPTMIQLNDSSLAATRLSISDAVKKLSHLSVFPQYFILSAGDKSYFSHFLNQLQLINNLSDNLDVSWYLYGLSDWKVYSTLVLWTKQCYNLNPPPKPIDSTTVVTTPYWNGRFSLNYRTSLENIPRNQYTVIYLDTTRTYQIQNKQTKVNRNIDAWQFLRLKLEQLKNKGFRMQHLLLLITTRPQAQSERLPEITVRIVDIMRQYNVQHCVNYNDISCEHLFALMLLLAHAKHLSIYN